MAKATRKKPDNGDFAGAHNGSTAVTDDRIRARIAEQAYYLYEKRGRIPGHEAEDWLQAERMVLAELSAPTKKPARTVGRRKVQGATV
jgi:DUF2934 family protein